MIIFTLKERESPTAGHTRLRSSGSFLRVTKKKKKKKNHQPSEVNQIAMWRLAGNSPGR